MASIPFDWISDCQFDQIDFCHPLSWRSSRPTLSSKGLACVHIEFKRSRKFNCAEIMAKPLHELPIFFCNAAQLLCNGSSHPHWECEGPWIQQKAGKFHRCLHSTSELQLFASLINRNKYSTYSVYRYMYIIYIYNYMYICVCVCVYSIDLYGWNGRVQLSPFERVTWLDRIQAFRKAKTR